MTNQHSEMKSAQARPSASVIVCCYTMDRWDEILEALDSLDQQTLLPQEVLVVSDGNAELAERVRAENRSRVRVIALETNQGLSAARNAGIDAATTEWVAFLDDDAAAEPEWLERLIDACLDTGASGSGGCAIPKYDGPVPAWMPDELLWTVGCSHKGLPTTRTRVRNFFGGCCALRTDVLRSVGGFDPAKGRRLKDMNGGEEADLCLRVREVDPDSFFVYEPAARIHHHVPANRLTPRYVLSRCAADGRTKSKMASALGARSLGEEIRFVLRTPVGAARLVGARRPQAAGVLLGGVGAAAWGALRGKADVALAKRRAAKA